MTACLTFSGAAGAVSPVPRVQEAVAAALDACSGDNAHITRLPNGLTVLVKQDKRFPLVSLRLYVHAGSAYETPKEAGISHVLEHMVFKGTEKRPKGQVAADVEKTGGYLNAATSFDYTVYITDMTAEHWKTGLDVLNDMAFHPSLDPADLEAEKDVIIAELNRGEDNPAQRLFRLSQQASLEGTPYGSPIIGFEETVRGLSVEDIRNYIDRLYQPQSMLLVAVGDVSPEELTAEAARLFGGLQNKKNVTPPELLDRLPAKSGFTASVQEGPWNKVHLSLTFRVPGMADVRSAQLDVLAQVLGGDATSRFYRTYKYDKRLVDGISVGNYSFERLGLIYIQATLDADKLVPFWETFTNDLLELCNTTFSNEELARAKLNIEDDLFRSKETLAGYASKLGYFSFFGGGEAGEGNYLRTVRDTDQRILLELINEYFKPETFSLVALMPEGAKLADNLPKDKRSELTDWAAWISATVAAKHTVAESGKEEQRLSHQKADPETIDLGKGRTLVLVPDNTLPYIAANLVFTGGDTLLPPSRQGIAAFTASLLGKGTATLSANAFEDYLSDRAAALGASAGRQSFSLSMTSPTRFTDDMFALLQDVLVNPAMLEEEAARVRENQIAAVTMREDQPVGLAFRRLFPFLFNEHPYGYLALGEKDRIAKFSAKDARDFWKDQTLQPWVLAVCGSFDRDSILAAVEKLPVPGRKAATPAAPGWGKNKELDLHLPGRNQGHLFMVFPTVGQGGPDEAGLELLQNILAGQSGLLFRDLRDEQSLGYTVTAFPWKADKAGTLIFYIGTEPEKMRQAEEGFRSIIASLQKDLLPEEELARGKNQIQGDYYREHQSLASRSAEAAVLTVLGRPLDSARDLVEQAQKVDAEALRELARKYLDAEKAYIVKVLP